MKIIPLATNDLRTIIKRDIHYPELYNYFERAFTSGENHPQKWYDQYVNIDNIVYEEASLPLMAAEDIYVYGSIPIDLPNTNRNELMSEDLDLILMYAIPPSGRQKTEIEKKIALGIKESMLSKEQIVSYKSVKHLMFHYWSNPKAYHLTKEPLLVDRDKVPSDYIIRMEKDAVKFLLLEYDPQSPSDLGNIDILKTQRRGEIRYLPFVTTLDSIRIK